jgi:hypothetical protein
MMMRTKTKRTKTSPTSRRSPARGCRTLQCRDSFTPRTIKWRGTRERLSEPA